MNPTNLTTLFVLVLAAAVALAGCGKGEEHAALDAKIVLPQGDITIKEREAVLFKASASGGTPPYRFAWVFGQIAPDFSGQFTPEIVFDYEGAYTVTLTVTDAGQNKAADDVKIIVTRSEALY